MCRFRALGLSMWTTRVKRTLYVIYSTQFTRHTSNQQTSRATTITSTIVVDAVCVSVSLHAHLRLSNALSNARCLLRIAIP